MAAPGHSGDPVRDIGLCGCDIYRRGDWPLVAITRGKVERLAKEIISILVIWVVIWNGRNDAWETVRPVE